MLEGVAEPEINEAVRDGGVQPRRAVGGGVKMGGPYGGGESCEQNGIVKGGTDLADAAADVLLHAPLDDDACVVVAGLCCAGAYGVIEGKLIAAFDEDVVQMACGKDNVLPPFARIEGGRIDGENRVDGRDVLRLYEGRLLDGLKRQLRKFKQGKGWFDLRLQSFRVEFFPDAPRVGIDVSRGINGTERIDGIGVDFGGDSL